MEHKFRVWCKNNREWEKDECFLRANGALVHRNERGTIVLLRPDTHIVSMFTGLRDSKRTEEYPEGQEIYEGDIVKLCDTNPVLFKVEIISARFGYKTVFKHLDDGTIAERYFLDKCEVIGSIYDNPELLEGRE